MSDSSLGCTTTPCVICVLLPTGYTTMCLAIERRHCRGWIMSWWGVGKTKQRRHLHGQQFKFSIQQFKVHIHCLMKQRRPCSAASLRTDPSWKSERFSWQKLKNDNIVIFFHLTCYRDKCTSATAHSSPETMYATPLQTGQLCSCERLNWCVYCLVILITTGHFLIQRTAKKKKQLRSPLPLVEEALQSRQLAPLVVEQCDWSAFSENVEKGSTEKLPKLMFCV